MTNSVYNLLNFRSPFVNINKKISAFLPENYSHFVQTFQLGNNTFKLPRIKTKNWENVSLSCVEYNNTKLGYEYKNYVLSFFSEEEILHEIEKYEEQIENFHKNGFILIGSFDISDAILLGVTEKNKDEIWSWNGDWNFDRGEFTRLEENIYKFIENCQESIIYFNLDIEGIKLPQLYRNWGEDFWRVREE